MAGIYVHIPFCHSKCAYCDFYSTPHTDRIGSFIQAVIAEWQLRRDELSGSIGTIYIGGGTPSILDTWQLSQIIHALPTDILQEFTLEANPEDISLEKVEAWQDLGINRVSMGVQSLDDKCLRRIGRRHNAASALRAAETLRAAGITNVSLDAIYGLPGQDMASWEDTLDGLLAYHPEHLSAYALSVEQGTRLYAAIAAGKTRQADDDTYAAMYEVLCEKTIQAGYEHYEISNFALPGHRAVHNSHYWDMTPYIGLGPGAHSWDGHIRRVNPSNLPQYIRDISSGKTAYEIEDETDRDRINDIIFTALRTIDGLDMRRLPGHYRDRLSVMAAHNPGITTDGSRIYIPQDKWLVSDAIIRDMLFDD